VARNKGKKLTDKRQAKTPNPPQPKETQPQLREVSHQELERIFKEHQTWLDSEGKEGNEAKLRQTNLQKANLTEANLQRANLTKANLQKANLWEANLQEAELRKSNLEEASLFQANLQEADLSDANLQGANLQEAEAVTSSQIKQADNWELAFYSDDLLKELGLRADHNETVLEKLAEIETAKEKAAAKP